MITDFQDLYEACHLLPGIISEAGTCWVAYSGGCDSHVLLHLMSEIRKQADRNFSLKAIHVNHRIHPDSFEWVEHCKKICSMLDVPLEVIELAEGQVSEHKKQSGSEENAARELRYEKFRQLLGSTDCLLMAHHADDQLETIFYRLVRGSGLTGLSGMPQRRPLGKGELVRPLLQARRSRLETYAAENSLDYLNDPGNLSPVHDRNFIRQEILPRVEQRWPGYCKSWQRSSRLIREADGLLEQLALIDLEAARTDKCNRISLDGVITHDEPRQRNLVRFWLRTECSNREWPEPDYVSLSRIVSEVINASASAIPVVRWPKSQPVCEIRRYDGCLYLLPNIPGVPEALEWPDTTRPLILGNALGKLVLQPTENKGFRYQPGSTLRVAFNPEGLNVKAPGEATRNFRKYCQQKRIPPWIRSCMPLVYSGDILLSVGNAFIPEGQFCEQGENLYQIHWLDADLD